MCNSVVQEYSYFNKTLIASKFKLLSKDGDNLFGYSKLEGKTVEEFGVSRSASIKNFFFFWNWFKLCP